MIPIQNRSLMFLNTLALAWVAVGAVGSSAPSHEGVTTLGDDATSLSGRTQGLRSLDLSGDGASLHLLYTTLPEGSHAGTRTGEASHSGGGSHGGGGAQMAEIYHLRSRDGGSTWTGGSRVNGAGSLAHRPGHTSAPQIAAIGERLLAVWTTEGTGFMGRGPIEAAFSVDGGTSWQPVQGPEAVAEKGAQAFLDLAVDAQGAFHMVWLESRLEGATRKGLYSSTTKDLGAHWSEPALVDPETCECCWNRLTYSPEENALYTVYRDIDPRDMSVARREIGTDGAWERLGFAGAFDWQFDGCPHIGGGVAVSGDPELPNLHTVVWTGHDDLAGVYYVRSGDGGDTWDPPVELEGTAMRPAIASTGEASVLMAWDGRNEDGSGGVVRISLSRDHGESWSEPIAVSSANAVAEFPLVVAVPEGFRVFWMEAVGATKSANSHLVRLSDAG